MLPNKSAVSLTLNISVPPSCSTTLSTPALLCDWAKSDNSAFLSAICSLIGPWKAGSWLGNRYI